MPLPEGFNSWEHLQDQVRIAHNKAVQLYFKNQPDDDISTPKRSLKHACLIQDIDTVPMVQLRMWLFEITVGHASSIQTPIYGIPVQEYQSEVKYRPQIKLFFIEPLDSEVHHSGIRQVQGEITFRLMNESSESINRSDAERFATIIKNELATPPFIWEKGWYKSTYLDAEHGYSLRLLVKSKAEAEKIVRKVLSIQNHSFSYEYFQFIEHERNYPIIPGTHRVYGQTAKKPRQRPRANVRFSYAQLYIWGRMKPVNLVSVGGRLQSVIQRV